MILVEDLGEAEIIFPDGVYLRIGFICFERSAEKMGLQATPFMALRFPIWPGIMVEIELIDTLPWYHRFEVCTSDRCIFPFAPANCREAFRR